MITENDRHLTDAEIRADLGIKSKTTLWRVRKADKTFPKPIQLTPGKRVTPASEYQAWKASRPRVGAKVTA